MEPAEVSTPLVNNNNNNYNNYNSTKNTKMTSAENTSYEDDFEKDTSSDTTPQQQSGTNDSSILNDSSNNDSNSNNVSVKKSDDSYEDDFEKDLSMDDSTKNVSSSPRKFSDDDDIQTSPTEDLRPPLTVAVTTPASDTNTSENQIIHREGEASDRDAQPANEPPPLDVDRNIVGPQSQKGPPHDAGGASDNESEEPDADAYNFTEDQRRAMLELMVQKQEDVDLLDEEPPEYNVKGRLEQLNAELANDPAPVEGERETRVGFKAEIVDLVAPPQDFSDDDASQPNSARDEAKLSPFAATTSATTDSKSENPPSSPQKSSPFAASSARNDAESEDGRGKSEESKNGGDNGETKKLTDDPNKKQFVVERDGQFSVLSSNELTPSERAMLMEEGSEGASTKQAQHASNNTQSKETRSNGDSKSSGAAVVPRPPNQPRPNTAATSNGAGRRSFVKQAGQQSPRPKSADHQQQGGKRGTSSSSSSHSSGLSDDFNYRSPYARSDEVREMSREQSRKQEEERREKEKRRKEEEQQRREYNDSAFEVWLRKKREENQRRADDNMGDKKKSDDERVKENEDAYKAWLKEKRAQGKKEKLLHRREQQEKMEGYFMRPREECEQAFKEWLKKKNSDLRRQQSLERQRSKMYRVQVKRSRKTQALVRALKESQAFRYVDYYGYRY